MRTRCSPRPRPASTRRPSSRAIHTWTIHPYGLTTAGERKLREAEEIADAIRDDVLGTLSDDDRRVFLGALTQLVGGRLAEPVQCAQPVRRRAPRS